MNNKSWNADTTTKWSVGSEEKAEVEAKKPTPTVIDTVDLHKQFEKMLAEQDVKKKTGSVNWDYIKKKLKGVVSPLEQLHKRMAKAFAREQAEWTLEGLVGKTKVRRFTGWDTRQGRYTGEKLRNIRRTEVIEAVSETNGQLDPLIARGALVDLWKPTDFNAAASSAPSRQVKRLQARKAEKKALRRAKHEAVSKRRQTTKQLEMA